MTRKIFSLALAVLMLAGLGLLIIPAQANTVYGDVDGNGHINAADVTLLRRRVSQGNENGLPSNYNRANADVNGDTFIDINDVTLLRRHVAAVDPSTVPLGPPPALPTGRFISLTLDDGPQGNSNGSGTDSNATVTVLNHLRTFNARSNVVCGRNGPMPCPASRVGRYGTCVRNGGSNCGTQSRAHVSFYVMNAAPSIIGHHPAGQIRADSRILMRRMLAEGHSIENHTMTHNISPSSIRTEISGLNTQIREVLHGADIMNHEYGKGHEVLAAGGPITDFYGTTWSNSNPYKPFSFRPNNFRMASGYSGADKETGMPWMFAGMDVDDWRGHTGQMMLDWIRGGSKPQGQRPCDLASTTTNCGLGCSFSSAWNSYPGVTANAAAADGGVVLLHDTNTAVGAQAAAFVNLVVPALQPLNYHFVTIEKMFTYMDAEWAWMSNASSIQAGDGNGTRFNDWVVRGARRTGTGPRPSILRGGNFVTGN